MNPDIAQQFDDWLSEHFDPVRTQTGKVSRRGGVTRYPSDVHRELRHLLGTAIPPKTLRTLRAGDDVPARVRTKVRQLLEWGDPETIRARRRDEALVDELRHAEKVDKDDLEAWARRRKERLDNRYDTDAPMRGEARERYRDIVEPAANRWRRKRRAA